MQKIIISSLLVLMFFSLTACSKSEEDDFARYYPDLLPNAATEYRLYAVGNEITREQLQEEDIDIAEISYRSSIETVNQEYPRLELEESPAYLLFDINGLVHKTYDYEKLINYLKEHPEPELN
ncbi:hypothetical protein [Lentibacillus sediminis]|uniref:hypothetical protein n=1 Tax=Lentibacillus sediminis TaxID=1940529 RepID=UPI000C1BA36B|nr:hypothetical protein [Lentibacillus sediminis]